MKHSLVVAIIALLIIFAGAAGYLAGFYTPRTTATNVNSSSSSSRVQTSTNTTVSCTISGPTEGVVIQVLENSGSTVALVAGAQVGGKNMWYCNNQPQITYFNSTATNSTGWASLLYGGGGLYYVSIAANSNNYAYNLTIPTQPTSITYAAFNISSGNITTHYCEFCQS